MDTVIAIFFLKIVNVSLLVALSKWKWYCTCMKEDYTNCVCPTVSASMQLRVFEPYFTDFCPVKEILDELTDFLPFQFVTS